MPNAPKGSPTTTGSFELNNQSSKHSSQIRPSSTFSGKNNSSTELNLNLTETTLTIIDTPTPLIHLASNEVISSISEISNAILKLKEAFKKHRTDLDNYMPTTIDIASKQVNPTWREKRDRIFNWLHQIPRTDSFLDSLDTLFQELKSTIT